MASVRLPTIGPKFVPSREPKLPSMPKLPQIRVPRFSPPKAPRTLSQKGVSQKQPNMSAMKATVAAAVKGYTKGPGGSGAVPKGSLPKASPDIRAGATEPLPTLRG